MSVTTSMVRSFQASNPNPRLLGGFNNYYENSVAINNHLPIEARVIVTAKPRCHFKFPVLNNMHWVTLISQATCRALEISGNESWICSQGLQTLLGQKKKCLPLQCYAAFLRRSVISLFPVLYMTAFSHLGKNIQLSKFNSGEMLQVFVASNCRSSRVRPIGLEHVRGKWSLLPSKRQGLGKEESTPSMKLEK